MTKFFSNIFSITSSYDKRYKIIKLLGAEIKIDKLFITNKDKEKYIDYVLNHQLDKTNFVEHTQKPYTGKSSVKLVSWYLPQYHDFEENVKWFGKGFSEWSNTSKTVPQYTGHYQPHIPIDVGYYNLETPDILKRQIELAKHYGIYGFGFYYYWFSGKKLMEKPLENFLKDKSLDMPFFMFWANEHWTKLWGDGEMNKILFKQELLENDDEKFMNDILPYMKDDRYIKIDNKPVLVIYQTEIFEHDRYLKFVDKINQIAKENGFNGIYLMTPVRSKMINDIESHRQKYKLDAMFEFAPMGFFDMFKRIPKKIMNKNFKGSIFDIKDFVKNKKYFYKTNCTKLLKGCFPTWDNTARKCYNGCYIMENSPQNYKIWLKDLIKWTKENHNTNEQFVFVNAWNEWAEGAHLEPDQKYGYAYLQATKEALEECE